MDRGASWTPPPSSRASSSSRRRSHSAPSQNMAATARWAWSMLVEASAGLPMTSPAAWTFRLEVASVALSMATMPRSATSTPAAPRPAAASWPTA